MAASSPAGRWRTRSCSPWSRPVSRSGPWTTRPSTGRSASARPARASSARAPTASRTTFLPAASSSRTPPGPWQSYSGSPTPGTRSPATPLASASSRSRWRACRTFTSRRRSGPRSRGPGRARLGRVVVLIDPYAPDLTLGFVTEPDERAARRTLRDQIARLEAQLADCVTTAFSTRGVVSFQVTGVYGPRVLGIAELERVRDDLAGRVGDARKELTAHGEAQERARVRLERMLLAPGRHKFAR